jgi:hypothetical protein
MTFSKLITKCFRAWSAWNDRKRMARVMPEQVETFRRIKELQRKHRPTKDMLLKQQERMSAALRGGDNALR